MKGKYRALDIANLYVELANSIPDDSIDNLKLNKICYYAQAWCLTKLGYPLFSEPVEAWMYGPVIRPVYNAFKVCGIAPILEPTYQFDEAELTSEELSLLTDVYRTYGKYTSNALMHKTHEAGSPWDIVYKEQANNQITEELMIDYFKANDELETMQLNITPENVREYA